MLDPLQARATRRTVASAVIVAIVAASLLLTIGPQRTLREKLPGRTLLETRFGYNAAQLYETFDTLGDAGRAVYRSFLLLDLLFPFFYAIPLALVIVYFLPASSTAAVAPLAAGVADWIENLVLLRLLDAYPRRDDGLAAVAGAITAAKLILVYVSLLLAIAAVARSLLRRVRVTRARG